MKKTYNKLAVLFCFAMLAFAGNTLAQDGCTNTAACNFDAAAVTDDGSCLILGDPCDDGDAATGNDTVVAPCDCVGTPQGCTNTAACNFDAAAVLDDGSCELPGDPCDDGDITTENDTLLGDCSCVGTPIQGCTNTAACNFDSTAAIDDGSCILVGDACDDFDATTGNDTVQPDCSCAGEPQGCTNTAALNFTPGATLDDGSCILPGCATAPVTWNYCYDNSENAVVAVFAEDNPGELVTIEFTAGDVEAGWDVITIYDGPNNASPILFSGDGALAGLVLQSTGATLAVEIVSDTSNSCGSGFEPAIDANVYCATEVQPGCTNTAACNYDMTATFDDGTCALPGDACDDGDAGTTNDTFQADCSCLGDILGCTATDADNYDPLAVVDDGTCLFNDNCSSAEVVTCGSTVSGSTLQASAGQELLAPACGPSIDGPGVWYTIVGDGVNEITASTCGSTYDSRIHVYSGTCGAFVCEGGNDDSDCDGVAGNELQSTVTWFGAAGVDYYVHVSGWNGALGDFDISFTCAAPTCVPTLLNDQCGSAFPLADGALFQGTNACAYANDLQPACDPFAVINGVWYVWNSGANNAAIIDFATAAAPVTAAAVEPAVAMYSGNCANPTELFCEDFALPVVGAEITGLTIGTDYYFLVWTDDDVDEGEFELTVTGGIAGCTTLGACNYNPAATIDDGTCDLSCIGCTNTAAINYNPTATFDDGSCILPGCADAPVSFGYCYENSDNITFLFQENNPGEGVTIEFLAGNMEAGWDTIEIFDGSDNTAASLSGGQIDGDLTGLVFQSTGANLAVEIIADTSNSCGSGFVDAIDALIYCGFEVILGCTDSLATNYNPLANVDDGTCVYFGCTNTAACNYSPNALTDDGTCCLDNCTTVEITDTFGDGSGSFAIFDDMSNLLASGSLDDGSFISFDFCLPDGCLTLVVTEDAFPDEMGLTITTQDGLLYEEAPGNGVNTDPTVIDFGSTGLCDIAGCMNPIALNYNPDANQDCLGVTGGTDETCCQLPVGNNDCDGAIALTAGTVENWDTTDANDSGYNCAPTLQADVWYTYTPPCEMEVTITSISAQGGNLGVWEGDCAGDALTLVECFPNEGFTGIVAEVVLQAGVTYYIQTGSNSDFGVNSTGTIELTEGDCRGCIYPDALNYDASAVIDNGGCMFDCLQCAGDFNDDGLITAADLTGFLSVFGGSCTP